MQTRMQIVVWVVVPIVEVFNNLLKIESIHDPGGNLLDMRFEIRAKIYIYVSALDPFFRPLNAQS